MASWTAATWPEILAAQQQARDAAAKGGVQAFQYLDPADAREIEALVDQIVPSGDTPGASEAGVIYFIDKALASFDRDKQDAYRSGLALVQTRRKAMFPASPSIAGLGAAERIQLLQSIETTPFFQQLRTHTLLGFLCDPSHGGNRGGAGWKVEGFESRMTWQPPFGYYDAQVNGKDK